MRPVKMDRLGLLAAAMYEILENRRAKEDVISFSVLAELLPGVANDQVMFGSVISGHIQTNKHIVGREFTLTITDTGDIRIEIPRKTVCYPQGTSSRIDVKEPVEINFEKRSITYKQVYNFNMKNVSWDWQAVKGTAADIIGMILTENF